MSLTTRKAVLNNIEFACNMRNINALDELLDDNFTFFLHLAGGGLPLQWGRVVELETSRALFESNVEPAPDPVAVKIEFDLDLDGLQWDPIVPQSAPTETWYATTIAYTFRIEMESDLTYVSIPGATATFVVREIETTAGPKWRLVEWRDRGDTVFAQRAVSTEMVTWGEIKSLYR